MGKSDSMGREGAAVHSLVPFHSIRERAMLTECLRCPKHFAVLWGLPGEPRQSRSAL